MTVQSELWRAALAEGKKRLNKYGAKRTMIDNITFDSKAEARYYQNLRYREALGEVTDVKLQEPFVVLGPKGQVVCTFRADFVFWDVAEKRRRIIDVKGKQTRENRLKQKVVEAFLGITIELAD
jgi:sucrose-6-phosphate hydrolase SacC (GH32 family)